MTGTERMPSEDHHAEPTVHETPQASRRGVLLAGLGLLIAGCASGEKSALRLPGPAWDAPLAAGGGYDGSVSEVPVSSTTPEPVGPSPAPASGVIPRTRWARGNPVPGLMNRMRPVRYITVHHDGMTPFYGADARSAAARLELIRKAHRNRGWGDIGYHFAIDRSGRIWSARPVGYQGAHVRDHNEGNVGIVVLGNFDAQQPTPAQRESLRHNLGLIARSYNVSGKNIRTHKEWAKTACPGRYLQAYVDSMRAG